MSDTPNRGERPTREERLAAKLRENLHRRKSQARGMKDPGPQPELSNDDEAS